MLKDSFPLENFFKNAYICNAVSNGGRHKEVATTLSSD